MNNCEYIENHIKPSDALEQLFTSAAELVRAAICAKKTGNIDDKARERMRDAIAEINVAATVVCDKLSLGYESISDKEVEIFARWAKQLKEEKKKMICGLSFAARAVLFCIGIVGGIIVLMIRMRGDK